MDYDKTQKDIDFALMNQTLTTVSTDVKEIKESLKKDYVTKEEFQLVQRIVYGMVALIVLGFMGVLVTLVYHSGSLPQ